MDRTQTTSALGRSGAGSSNFDPGSVACAGVVGLVAGALLPLVGRQLKGAFGGCATSLPCQFTSSLDVCVKVFLPCFLSLCFPALALRFRLNFSSSSTPLPLSSLLTPTNPLIPPPLSPVSPSGLLIKSHSLPLATPLVDSCLPLLHNNQQQQRAHKQHPSHTKLPSHSLSCPPQVASCLPLLHNNRQQQQQQRRAHKNHHQHKQTHLQHQKQQQQFLNSQIWTLLTWHGSSTDSLHLYTFQGRFLSPPPAQQPAAAAAAGAQAAPLSHQAPLSLPLLPSPGRFLSPPPAQQPAAAAAAAAAAAGAQEPPPAQENAPAAPEAAAAVSKFTDLDLADVAVTWISPPHPDWQAPERLLPPFPVPSATESAGGKDGEEEGRREERKAGERGAEVGVVSVRVADCSSSVLYPLVISTVVPRPIAFISTLSKTGVGNLSPYSYFNAVAHNPPMLAIGHCWSNGKPKDSLANILDTRELVVALISDWFVEAANHTCGPFPSEVDEMERAGLTPVPSVMVKPPRVAESAVNMECVVRHTYDVTDRDGSVTTTIVLVEVVMFHFSEHVVTRTPNTGKLIVDPAIANAAKAASHRYSLSFGYKRGG
ncbi:unnamed protein product [Closterium sp. NIES-54]